MDRYCRICRNASCSNHGKNITFHGEGWKCNYIPVPTNADRIRAMSDEEMAKEMLFFCPTDTVFKGEDTYGKPHYTGLDGGYYETSEEVVASNLEWLKQPAEEE